MRPTPSPPPSVLPQPHHLPHAPLLTLSLISEKLEKNALQTHLFHSTWFRLILNFKLAFYRNH